MTATNRRILHQLPVNVYELSRVAKALDKDRAYGHVVTGNADGSPQLSMVWLGVDGDELLLNTSEGRRKVENLRRDAHVDRLAKRFLGGET